MLSPESHGIIALYLFAVASSSIIFTLVFHIIVVRPLSGINGLMGDLCRTVSAHPGSESSGGEIEEIREGLMCIARQWEDSRLKIEEANSEKLSKMEKMVTLGEMALSVAHDIKNPLAGISGAIQVFAEDFPEDDPRGEIVREVLGEISRLDRTVKDLQSYARPPEPYLLPTPVLHLLERAARSASDNAKKARVDVNIIECPESLEVDVDTELLHQVLMNIMDFSIKAMQGGGTLALFARTSTNRDKVEINLKDNGPGLKSESMNTLFRPFRTSRMSTRGLSMAISKALVELHGGTIEVESSQTAGTTFRIVLPSHKENA